MTYNPDFNHTVQTRSRIGYSAIGALGQFKIVSIMNLLQDAASDHAALLGLSGFDLAKKNLTWVISRYRIDIKRAPSWSDDITIKTWRQPWKNLYELRHFAITDKKDRDIVRAKAAWVMVKKENKKPVRLSRFIPGTENIKRNSPEDTLFNVLNPPEKTDCLHSFKVRMSDLDLNRHVNNAIYVGWAVETVPEYLNLEFRPRRIDVRFQNESFYGDPIASKTEIIQMKTHVKTRHSIFKTDPKLELARLNILWKPFNRSGE